MRLLFCLLVYSVVVSSDDDLIKIDIGVLAPKTLATEKSQYYFVESACHLVKQDLNNVLQKYGYEIEFKFEDSGCNSTLSIGGAARLVNDDRKVKAIIGPHCSEGCLPVGKLAAYENIPIISYGCASGELAYKKVYPTFARTKPFARTVPEYLKGISLQIFKQFKWTHTGIVYSTGPSWEKTFSAFRDIIKSTNETSINPIIPLEVYPNRREIVNLLKDSCRVIVFICYPKDVNEILSYTYEAGMNSGEYAFIAIDYSLHDNWKKEKWFIGQLPFQGLLTISVKSAAESYGEDNHDNFIRSLKQIMYYDLKYDYGNISYYDGAAYTYDAAKMYIMAIDRMLKEEELRRRNEFMNITKIDQFLDLNNLTLDELAKINLNISEEENSTWTKHPFKFPTNWTLTINGTLPVMNYSYEKDFDTFPFILNGTLVMNQIFSSNFKGKSGDVNINKDGDRFPILVFNNLQIVNNKLKFERVLEYDIATNQMSYLEAKKIIWPGGGKDPPVAVPPCGFDGRGDGEGCREPGISNRDVAMLIITPVGVIVGIYILYRMYKRQQYEKDLMNQDSVFKYTELIVPQLLAREKERQTKLQKLQRSKSKRKGSFDDIDVDDNDSEKNLILDSLSGKRDVPQLTRRKNLVAQKDIYKGIGQMNQATGNRYFFGKLRVDNVFVKKIPKSTVHISRDVLVEMKEVRDLRHPNLNPYVGFCLGPPYVLIASISCKKGNLQDVLFNEGIQLDWVFRNTFANDIISGICAIHESSIGVHGHLTSRNILVDNRWNCKLTDFGLRRYKDISEEVHKPEIDEDKKFETLLWTAPENINIPHVFRSKEGDVYSFGIILSEIINRQPPFSTYSQYSARDYVHFVHKRCIPVFRPHVRLQAGLDGRTLDMMRSCWDEFPENRPTIQEVKATFRNIIKDVAESNNLLDNMIEMMERYAHELELTVQDRTEELRIEKEKCDTLFYRSLPPTIADQIKKGQEVATRKGTASILAFRVDDFTSLIESLEPQQAVNLLHDVHKVVEGAIMDEDKQDCHKLQYNRDACIIVSGTPEPVKNRHSVFLARIALRIMGSLTEFRFRHIDDELMRFKIAIHSGKFISGIVGLRVPVFSAIGKEIDIAEGLSLAIPTLRIFVSKASRKYMEASKGVTFEIGNVPILVKGMGVIEGNFLKSVKGIRVKLRNPNLKMGNSKRQSIA